MTNDTILKLYNSIKRLMNFGFQRVIAWQKAHDFVLSVYRITKLFPEDEKFGLTSQFRRAAVSIETNIAEGYKKISKADKLRFFNIAQGSLEECRDYIILSLDLNYISEQEYNELCSISEYSSRMINSYCEGIINNNATKNDQI